MTATSTVSRAPATGSCRPERASETDAPAARLLPLGSGVAFMLSETVPHAVEVTHARRYAIAGWWRVNQSGDARVDPIS